MNSSQKTPTPQPSADIQPEIANGTLTPGPAEAHTTPETQATREANSTIDYLSTAEAQAAVEPVVDASQYQQEFRPQYHFSPVSGWIGDPDGTIFYKGIYHLFWWGHAESKDLVHWNERPRPMIGVPGKDSGSGSVVIDARNDSGFAIQGQPPPMLAFFTDLNVNSTGHQAPGLSISYDYTRFAYYEQSPVVESDRPAFRDPQVFYDKATARWIMVIALSDDHHVSFYASKDLKHWEHLSDFGPVGAQSQVWETPDIFQLSVDGNPNNEKWVLLTGMGPNREQYFIGDFDGTKFTLDPALNGYLLRGQGLPGQVFADFENGLPAGWTAEGDKIAVGGGDNLGTYHVAGFIGSGFLSTYTPGSETGDRGKVKVTSPAFTIDKGFINFLISGGNYPNQAAVNLLIDGAVVRSATGDGTDLMKWAGWAVSEFKGKQGQIQILDDMTTADFGHVNVDQIMFSDTPALFGQEHANWLDFGADYYAVRTYRDYDHAGNRVVTMGWLGNWEYANDVPTSWGKGAEALPREISLQSYAGGLRIVQRPIPALEGLRQTPVEIAKRVVNGVIPLSEFQPALNAYEIDATFVITDPGARFGIKTAANGNYGVSVGYDARTSTLFLDRMNSENDGFNASFPKYLTAPLLAQDGKIRLHLFVDQSSIEVFANDGLVTMSALMFPNPGSLGIELFSKNGGTQLLDLTAWELNSIWGAPTK